MDTLGERFETVLKAKGEKKTDAARKLNISPSHITKICKRETYPSVRTIADFCKLYAVNEHWLRTGMGEMFMEKSEEQELTEFLTQLIQFGSDDFRTRFITSMAKLTPDDWAVLEKIANELAQKKKESGK